MMAVCDWTAMAKQLLKDGATPCLPVQVLVFVTQMNWHLTSEKTRRTLSLNLDRLER